MAFEDYEDWGTVDTGVSFKAITSAPIDSRFFIDSKDNIDTEIPKSVRYPGLRVYVLDEKREYWFQDGVKLSNLVVYNPQANLTGDSLEDFDNVAVSNGAEITVLDNGEVSKYVWNGSEWKLLTSTVTQSVTPTPSPSAVSNVVVTGLSTDTYEEVVAVLNNYISQNNITLSVGYEITVVFSDPQTNTFFNRYIYLPSLADSSQNHWYIESGIQSFDIQVPNEILISSLGATYTSSDTTSGAKYVTYNRTQDGVDVVITHNFCSLFVDVVVYEKGNEAADIDDNGTVDSDFGTMVGIPTTCVKSGNQYKVVVSFPTLPSATDRFTILVQK